MENKLLPYSWSLDISTTNVGAALWDENGVLKELKHFELTVDKSITPEERILVKADMFAEYISNFEERVKESYGACIKNVFVEAPFSNTPKNINTTAMLLGFNGIARYILYKQFGKQPYMITVHQSRKIFCPELEPNIEWFYTRNETLKSSSFDMSDAYCVGYSGLKVFGKI